MLRLGKISTPCPWTDFDCEDTAATRARLECLTFNILTNRLVVRVVSLGKFVLVDVSEHAPHGVHDLEDADDAYGDDSGEEG